MKVDIEEASKLINSIRFYAECYGVDRTIEPPHGVKKSHDEQVNSARQTYVDLRILMMRLEGAVWPGRNNEQKDEKISNRSSSEN